VIWLFLARSTSHPVVAQSDCTNIPLAAGGARLGIALTPVTVRNRNLIDVLK